MEVMGREEEQKQKKILFKALKVLVSQWHEHDKRVESFSLPVMRYQK
jgi:hypothetical protein